MPGEVIRTTKTKSSSFLPISEKNFTILCYLIIIFGLMIVISSVYLSYISASTYNSNYLIFAGFIFLLLIVMIRGGTVSLKRKKEGDIDLFYRGEPQVTTETQDLIRRD